ncbi:MAG: erythromycin esterase family protein [Pseudomonadota bacterium]
MRAVDLDFEQTTPMQFPYGWHAEGDAATTTITVKADADAPSGKRILSVANTGEEPLALYAPLPNSEDCTNELRVTANIRSPQNSMAAGLLLEGGAGGPRIEPPTPASAEWAPVAFAIKPSRECFDHPSYFGFLVFGEVELDAVRIETNDGRAIAYPSLAPVRKADLEILADLSTTTALNQGSASLDAAFSQKLIALGEASHGAKSLFSLKFALLKTLAERDLSVFALEAPAAAADIVNEYVTGQIDDRDHALRALIYPSWQTEEMAAIVDWLREYNADAQRPIYFAGFDVQQPQAALQLLERNWSDSADITALKAAMTAGDTAEAISIIATLEQGDADVKSARYLRLLRKGLLTDRPDLGGQSRAAYMASEIEELANDTEGQIIIWGDNTHITKAPGAMGEALFRSFGNAYVSVGLTFANGFYSAYGPENPYLAESAYAGVHEHILLSAGMDQRFVALADLPAGHPLLELRGFRYIGSRPQEFSQFLPHRLQEHFDIIGFAEFSEATTYLWDNEF